MFEGAINFDVAVCGGGPAGVTAAIASASSGAKTLLIERLGRLGGMGTSGLVNQIPLKTDTPHVQKFYDLLVHHKDDSEFLDLFYADQVIASGAELLLHSTIYDVVTNENDGGGSTNWKTVKGVRLATPKGAFDLKAHCVIDATGDGTAAFLAGETFSMGRESDGLTQPVTIMFRVGGVDHEKTMEANGGRMNYPFKEGSWDHLTMMACQSGELPEKVGKVRTYLASRDEYRYVNATQCNYIDATDPFELTKAEIECRKQVPLIMEFLKRRAPGFKDAHVSLMPAVVGVRETRRFRGVTTLTRDDCLFGRRWPEAIATGCTAPLDVHNPDGPGQAEGVSEKHPAGRDPDPKPYDIPYGCLVPESIDGLLLSGRCISGDHHAHASYRFQTICMATGAAAGFAAAEAARRNVHPREIDVDPVQKSLGIQIGA